MELRTGPLRSVRIVRSLAVHLVLILIGIAMALPFLWMLSTSFKLPTAVAVFPPQLIPKPFTLQAYAGIFRRYPFGTAYLNSIKIAVIVVTGSLLTTSMAGFAFAKIQFPGRDRIFVAMLATLMIPNQVTLIPMFIVFKNFGWIDTHWPLTFPMVMSNMFGVFLLRQFASTIPDELLDAGRVDGGSPLTLYWRIAIPLSTPALATLAIFVFVGSWNDFLLPLIYLNHVQKFTVPMMVAATRGVYLENWPQLMAASCAALAPMIVVYFIGQRYFIEGITLTGLKS